jgi:hypothetical protein
MRWPPRHLVIGMLPVAVAIVLFVLALFVLHIAIKIG